MHYAEILIEHGYSRKQTSFTYEIPKDLEIQKGDGVVVQFQRSEKTGLVLDLHEEKPSFKTKAILRKLTDEPLLKNWQIETAEWISEYYFCSKYDALKLFLPKNILKRRSRKQPKKNNKIIQKTLEERTLTDQQAKIVAEIIKKKIPVSLLHGVTGAGKTEIYSRLIKNCIQNGGQALVLVPEIALTPQLLETFSMHFPRIAVIHSRITDAERAQLWLGIQKGEIDLVLGSRSALFSPFKKLDFIIIDEEHEWSYKQEQNPRYHAREVSLKIAEKTGAQVLLGSATPSIESMWHAKNGDYALFTMKERISGTALPSVEIIDMREELKSGNFTLFSNKLEQKMSSALAKEEQIILFLNRRGSASSTVCRDCGFINKCPKCDLPLTYHAHNYQKPLLICHHCGHLEKSPTFCPHCKSARIRHLGLGTERVETDLQKLFPKARIARADKDTMNKKNTHVELHTKLHSNEIDILIGTQMIGKGFDIARVNLVGILMADLGLHVPDFRTTERMFQLLTQVAGRAGRRKTQGEAILQTYNPDHPAIHFSKTHDYEGFYEQEISARELGNFPPFSKLIKLIFIERSREKASKNAEAIAKKLADPKHQIFSAPALFGKTRDHYQWNLLIQGPSPENLLKKLAPEEMRLYRIDVDPLISI